MYFNIIETNKMLHNSINVSFALVMNVDNLKKKDTQRHTVQKTATR